MTLRHVQIAAIALIVLVVHAVLIVMLSLRWREEPPRFDNPPMAVDIIAETAPVSTSPQPDSAAPAARLGNPDSDAIAVPPPEPVEARPRPVTPPPQRRVTPPRPEPRPAPTSRRVEPRRPPPQAERRDTPRPTPPSTSRSTSATRDRATSRDREPSGALEGIAAGVARDARREARGTSAPATATAAEIRADIRVSINNEVRGPWNACRVTGIDVDRLRTTIVFRLTQAGGLERIVSVNTTGVNDSNRPQVQRFEECARRAIQLAAPFAGLPAEHYSHWQTYTLDFEKR